MMVTCRARSLRALFPLLIIVACAAPPEVLAQIAGPSRPGPPPEVSVIAVPIRASLAPIAAEIEKKVEKKFTGKATERGININYDVFRDPIQLQMIGGGLHASTTVHYTLQACRGRFPCISCGIGEPRREAQIKFQTKLNWDASWRLRSTTRLLPVNYAKPCRVTWFDFDITRRFIAPVVDRQLGAVAQIIDKNTPVLTQIRPRAEQIWNALQTPSELAPRTWLVLEPTAVALTPIHGSGSTVSSTLLLHAHTRVVVGERPATTTKPLPALKTVPVDMPTGVRIPFDLHLPYEEASRLAARDYAGKTFQVNGRPLMIETLRLGPAGNGKLRVEANIDYRGGVLRNYRGVIVLEGTPVFDTTTSTITVPDLDYTLASRRGLVGRITARAAHDSIRQRLRESARFPLAPRMAELRENTTRALNRQLGPGVKLKGQAEAFEPVFVAPLDLHITIRVVAVGRVEVEVR